MIEWTVAYLMWTGILVNAAGATGVIFIALVWATDKFFKFTGLASHIIEWRIDKIKSKRFPG